MLRLPTIRDRFGEIAAAAEREQLSYLGFLAELVIAECDDRDPPPRRTPHPRRRVSPAKAAGGVLLRRQPGHQPRGHRPAGHLRLGQGRTPVVFDR